MKKVKLLLMSFLLLPFTVQAGFYDFTAEGNRDEQGYLSFTTGVTNGNPMPTGLTITATDDSGRALYAYMDGDYPDANGPGGLGVCKVVDGANGDICDPAGDDNQMGANEIIEMNSVEKITGFTIIGDHVPIVAGATLQYISDAGTLQEIDVSGAFQRFILLDVASNFLTYRILDGSMYVTSVTTVPVPAAAWLFGTALLGLFGFRRKSKQEGLAA